jgi:predicted nucleic acid-binding Zn ribbon protein
MRRLADVLPDIASQLGLEDELRLSRAIASWERLVGELVPVAAGTSQLLALQPPTLVVSASSPIVAQELRLRSRELLAAFAAAPGGTRLVELRVVIRPPTVPGGASGAAPRPV